MSIEEFSSLVRDMRAAQKEYFDTRSRESLQRAKSLEKQVDDAIVRHYHPEMQQTLFDLEPGTPSYVTLDSTPPDDKEGDVLTFQTDTMTTHIQVRNDGDIYVKHIGKTTGVQTTNYTQQAAETLLQYIAKRIKETKGGEE